MSWRYIIPRKKSMFEGAVVLVVCDKIQKTLSDLYTTLPRNEVTTSELHELHQASVGL
jgi:hypothetical protein